MSKRRALVSMLLLLSSGALADDFIGQASVIDDDTLQIHGTHVRLWGIDAPESGQLCRGEDSSQYRCGAQAANDLSAYIARRPPSTVSRSASTHMAAPLRPVLSTAPISANGSCAMALLWIGFNTRKADTPGLSEMPSVPGEVSGRAATSSRGCIVPASAPAESPPTVRTTQMPILDGSSM